MGEVVCSYHGTTAEVDGHTTTRTDPSGATVTLCTSRRGHPEELSCAGRWDAVNDAIKAKACRSAAGGNGNFHLPTYVGLMRPAVTADLAKHKELQ